MQTVARRCLQRQRPLLPPRVAFRRATWYIPQRRLLNSRPQPAVKETPRQRIYLASAVVAFLAGASFYLFLPDASRAAITLEGGPLLPRHFTPVTVISNEVTGPDTKLLRLAVGPDTVAATDKDGFKAIWSVFIKDDDIQVERPYTPLYGIDENGHMLFWIKKYPKGEVGRWLHTKVSGDTLELRGPLSTWGWKDDRWDEVVMISGGTGFAPFYQLFQTVISNPSISPSTRFRLLHSSRKPEDLPPESLLQPLLQYAEINPDRLNVGLFVDEDSEEVPRQYTLNVGRIGETSIQNSLATGKVPVPWWRGLWTAKEPARPQHRTLFLVCGPEPMVAAIAGPYGRNMSQGPLGGVLSKMGYASNQVYKL